MSDRRLEGKVAIVTGAGSGIGRATAQLFARQGARVILVGWTEAKLEAVAAELPADAVAVVPADVSVDEQCAEVVTAAIDRFGRLDVLVNAAGVGFSYLGRRPDSMGDVVNTSYPDWRHVLNLNLDSVFSMCHHAIPAMVQVGGGSIVNISSISGFLGTSAAHAYAAAKAGVISLSRGIAVTYARAGIRANCVAPGYVDTPLAAGALSVFDDEESAALVTPAARTADPAEIANGCLFMASDESSYCNGSVLVMDAGASVMQR